MTLLPPDTHHAADPAEERFPDHDRRVATGASGLLEALNRPDLLEAADVHVATRVAALGAEDDERVLLALALAVRALRQGSVCVDPVAVAADLPDLPWPSTDGWLEAVEASPLVRDGVLRVEDGQVYLDRYHRLESQVCRDLVDRADGAPPEVDEASLAAALVRVRGAHLSEEQEAAVLRAVHGHTTVLTGGPGTGKTTTVARLLVLLADQAHARGERLSVALAAPTGKAATRLQEAVVAELATLDADDRDRVGRPEAMTLHRLLGWRADNSTRFRHDRSNRLKYDLVVVDECSMVDLTMMARLLEAVRPQSRLVLVGDPGQLTSVGAGAVLADLVEGYAEVSVSPVAALLTNHRSTEHIKELARALSHPEPDPDEVLALLRRPSDEVSFVETDEPGDALRADCLGVALALREHALAGRHAAALTALDRHRLLCAHREGPYGVRHWNHQVEQWVTEETDQPVYGAWYAGRPLLITANDYALEVYNGETGVAVLGDDGRLRAWVSGSEGAARSLAPGRLDAVETMHAMTIHKSQGSQAEAVTVLLPEPDSRLLTRELFYTAVTRAQHRVRVVGTEESVRAAVTRKAQRASGLRGRLRRALADR